MGLDYQRLFDSMLHKWFIKDLEPEKSTTKKNSYLNLNEKVVNKCKH